MRALIYYIYIGTCAGALTAIPLDGQAPASPVQAGAVKASAPKTPGDSVTIRIVSTDLRSAVQIMQQYLDRPVIYTPGAAGGAGPQVTFETPRPVPRADVPKLLRGLLESQNYELVSDTVAGMYRARQKEAPRPATSSPSPVQPTGAPSAPRQTTSPELFVLALRHARASDVAQTINTLFGRGAVNGVPNANRGSAPTLADELRQSAIPPVDAAPLPQSIPGTSGRAATLSGDLTIVPDAHANSLLVRANRQDFELIRAAVQQIDVRPAQVLIEVLIVEAQRDRSFSLGIDAEIKDKHVANTANSSVGGSFKTGSAGLGDFALHVMGVSSLDLDATITAAAGRGDVKVVTRPTVLTANDEQAEVVVGSQRPFVQVSRTLPTENVSQDQIVQYKDVGTKLSVHPTISVDDIVRLNVTQEVSNATTETQFNAPVISTRSVKTDLLVKDGQTIVLGGLVDHQHDVQTQGIPLLSSIPFVGGFFGRQSRTTNETELFIFLTPHVIRTDEDAKRLTDPLRDQAKKIEP